MELRVTGKMAELLEDEELQNQFLHHLVQLELKMEVVVQMLGLDMEELLADPPKAWEKLRASKVGSH